MSWLGIVAQSLALALGLVVLGACSARVAEYGIQCELNLPPQPLGVSPPVELSPPSTPQPAPLRASRSPQLRVTVDSNGNIVRSHD